MSHVGDGIVSRPESVALLQDAIRHRLGDLVDDVNLTASAPQWRGFRRGDVFARQVTVTVATPQDVAQRTFLWPAPCDPQVDAPDGVYVGHHSGLFIGRPFDVVRTVTLRPGLHCLAQVRAADRFVDVVVVPDLGPARRSRTKPLDAKYDTEATIRASEPGENSTWIMPGGGSLPDDLDSWFAELVGVRPDRYFDPSTTEQIRRTLRELGVDDSDGEWLAAAAERAWQGPDGPVFRTSAAVCRVPSVDELVCQTLHQGIVTALRKPPRRTSETAKLSNAQWIASLIRRGALGALDDLTRGRGGLSATLADLGIGSTLERLEATQKVSFTGFRGLPPGLRGRADLRQLTPDWRGELCPVQTPESSKVGFTRYRTVSAWHPEPGEWADLSSSAALIPFVNHDDPARASIGSKNLKQAVPVAGAESPLVATGWERRIAEQLGVARSPLAGVVESVTGETITVVGRTGQRRTVRFGTAWLARSGPDTSWLPVVAEGESVRRDQIIAHAPDVVLATDDSGGAELALGVNALVALTPFRGLNYEDGIVITESLRDRLASRYLVRVPVRVEFDEQVIVIADLKPGIGGWVEPGDPLVAIGTATPARQIKSNVRGQYLWAERDERRGELVLVLRVERPVEVGDKLSNRHQGKGVVSAILPDSQMPRLPDGRPVEALLNPLGVLRRLNIGQLWEMHAGLPSLLTDGRQVLAGRTVADIAAVADACAAVGAPDGRMRLTMQDGSPFGGADGVVVGPQYLMRLNHLAVDKLSVRGKSGPRTARTGQPARGAWWAGGTRQGGAQRLGEMEFWGLAAAGATLVAQDSARNRAQLRVDEKAELLPSVRALAAHLACAGVTLTGPDGASVLTAKRPSVHTIGVCLEPSNTRWVVAEQGRLRDAVDDLATDSDTVLDKVAGGPWSMDERLHPLYREDPHGRFGTSERETPRCAIPLPWAVPHPWGKDFPLLQELVILPPAYRQIGLDPLNARYWQLAQLCRRLAPSMNDDVYAAAINKHVTAVAGISPDEAPKTKREQLVSWAAAEDFALLQRRVGEILGVVGDAAPETILGRTGTKFGLARRWLLGHTVTMSGRAVIVPDPDRDPETVGVPWSIAYTLEIPSQPNGFDDVLVLNRQPTLHPYNLVALRAVPEDGSVLRVHPVLLAAIAGDFDGDTATVHRPMDAHAREEAWRLLRPAANLRSAGNGRLLAKRDLDIALGLRLASGRGRAELADLGGESSAPWTVDDIEAAFEATVRDVDADTALARIVSLERLGFEAATGWSIGALELTADVGSHFEEADAVKAAKRDPLLVARGMVSGGNPHLPGRFVPGTFRTGLTAEDYFAAAADALNGLSEKKLTSPTAGAFTKSLIEIADDVVIDGDDCGLPADLASPLTCRGVDGVCRACYGADRATGLPLIDGRRVGVLAAMVIGERSTQLSMKVFQGALAAGQLGGNLAELKALFGQGRHPIFGSDEAPRTLASFVAEHREALSQSGLPRVELLQQIVARAAEVVGVDRVHTAIIIRRVLDTALRPDDTTPRGSLFQAAERAGRGPLERFTSRGNPRMLITDTGAETRPTKRTRLILEGEV